MKQYHKNPRQITKKQFEDLKRWLDEFGDLSGIVHDLNSDEIIGGNQRFHIFDLGEFETRIDKTIDPPDRQGTVARGKIIWKGMEYDYRQVRWTPEKCEQANLIANKAGGTFDFDILANQFDLETVLKSGFERFELGLSIHAESFPPADFKEYNEGISTDYRCPKCDYQWSGKPK